MTDVKIAIGFRWKPGHHPPAVFVGFVIGSDNLTNEVERGSRSLPLLLGLLLPHFLLALRYSLDYLPHARRPTVRPYDQVTLIE